MCPQLAENEFAQLGADRSVPVVRMPRRARNRRVVVDSAVQFTGQMRNAIDPAEMRQIHVLRIECSQPRHRRMPIIGVELHRCRRRKQVGPTVHGEVWIGDTKGVAGEKTAALLVPHAVVVTGVTGRIEEPQATTAQFEYRVVLDRQHPMLRYRG